MEKIDINNIEKFIITDNNSCNNIIVVNGESSGAYVIADDSYMYGVSLTILSELLNIGLGAVRIVDRDKYNDIEEFITIDDEHLVAVDKKSIGMYLINDEYYTHEISLETMCELLNAGLKVLKKK